MVWNNKRNTIINVKENKMGFHGMANMSEESEWWSQCCTAPPLYDLHEEESMDTIGICMACREHASFEIIKEGE